MVCETSLRRPHASSFIRRRCPRLFSRNTLFSEIKTIEATVESCNDGDTCLVSVHRSLRLRVRLAGIDAPETSKRKKKSQPFAVAARDFLNRNLKGQTVTLRQVDLDQYNRPIVEIFRGKKLINLEVLAAGFAEVYRGKSKHISRAAYLEKQDLAKRQKRGIWSLANYVSPREYRR